ncbi:MAG: hypothetical protein ACRECC_04095 [Pseudolabrys sp.]
MIETALENLCSMAAPATGETAVRLAAIVDRLGIAEQVKAKAHIVPRVIFEAFKQVTV